MNRRNTVSKEAVLAVLTSHKKAMSQDAIMKQMDIAADRATIYRVLNRFCEDQIVHKMVADDGRQYFAVCVKGEKHAIPNNHFHFRCVKCETIECLATSVEFSVPVKYKVESMNCVLIGTCKDCA